MPDVPERPRPMGAASAMLCVARLQDIPLTAACGLLSAAELERAGRINHREAWLQFVVARGLLRLVLGHCTGLSPRAFVLADAEGEAPRLLDNPWGLHFSVSHSHDYAAVAVSGSPVGVDIERVDATCNWAAIAHLCFHAREQERLEHAPEAERMGMFFDLWTRKEAYLKGVGAGFSRDPSTFLIAWRDGAVVPDGAPRGPVWHAQSIPAPTGYLAALASHRPRLAVSHIDAATIVGNLRAATQAARLSIVRTVAGMPGTNPEYGVTYRARYRFVPADDRCRFGTGEAM